MLKRKRNTMGYMQSRAEKGVGPEVPGVAQGLWRTSEGQTETVLLFVLVSQGCHNKLHLVT